MKNNINISHDNFLVEKEKIIIDIISEMTLATPLIFTGGTSLKIIHNQIKRFSEDIDFILPGSFKYLGDNKILLKQNIDTVLANNCPNGFYLSKENSDQLISVYMCHYKENVFQYKSFDIGKIKIEINKIAKDNLSDDNTI
jgi:predicted nucleotidyltransferase component of viral defense system